HQAASVHKPASSGSYRRKQKGLEALGAQAFDQVENVYGRGHTTLPAAVAWAFAVAARATSVATLIIEMEHRTIELIAPNDKNVRAVLFEHGCSSVVVCWADTRDGLRLESTFQGAGSPYA
ncbi:MAG: hypothetical protein L0Z50_24470, partial [Verrucomicrobiales bacterium]|nr:hypothetical protein [Verrucomicrobiales bacterium]